MTLAVLVVEDEPIVAEAHTAYVGRVAGFAVVATVHSGREALKVLATGGTDLVLLDMNLPDGHGLDVARDLDVVRAAVSLGVVQYLLKPFVFASLRDRLEAYADYRRRTVDQGAVATQGDVDQVFAELRAGSASSLPKGFSEDLWGRVLETVRGADQAMSANEVAVRLGVSRVTARRYLEHLADSAMAVRRSRHAGAGRPELEYRWTGR